MSRVSAVVNGAPRNIPGLSRDGVSVGGLKSALEKAMGIPRAKQRVFVGLLDVTNCEHSRTFCSSYYGEIYVVDDEHPDCIPRYNVLVTDFVGKSKEVALEPSPDITQLKTQLARSLEFDTGSRMFEVVCDETGVFDNDRMWKFKPWNTLRLVHCPFKMNCTIVRLNTGETQHVEAAVDPQWTAMNVIQSLGIPIGEYRVTVDGKQCSFRC